MPVTLHHNDLTIEVFDDSAFHKSSDNPTHYEKIYQSESSKPYNPASQHAIVIYKNNIKVASAILLESAGATSVTEDSIIIDDENLITRCCNMVYSLKLPSLELNWVKEVDWATCFSIHKYKNDFITHGEISIARIDRNGNMLWDYSGADIFLTLDGSSSFEMYNDYIMLKDFNNKIYKINYDGKTIP